MKTKQSIDLHMHITGSYPLSYLKTISFKNDYDKLLSTLQAIKNKVEYDKVFSSFEIVSNIVNTDKKVHNGIVALCQNLHDQGIIYSELRTGLRDLGNGFESYVQSILNAIDIQTDLQANVLLSIRRDSSTDYVKEVVRLAKKYDKIVGIDISGDESKGDLDKVYDFIPKEIPVSLHIGEVNSHRTKNFNYISKYSPKRIAHAIHMDEDTMQYILSKKIPVEICLTSNVKTGLVSSEDNHPVKRYLEKGHIICVATDDPLIFQTSISEEYSKMMKICRVDNRWHKYHLKECIKHSFATDDQKKKLFEELKSE